MKSESEIRRQERNKQNSAAGHAPAGREKKRIRKETDMRCNHTSNTEMTDDAGGNYILYHRNVPVLKFTLRGWKVRDILHVFNREHVPVGSESVHGSDWKKFFAVV